MRKYVTTLVCFIVLVFFTTNAFAQTLNLSTTTQKLSSVKFSSQGIQDQVSISLNTYSGYTVTRYSKPDRIVVDIPNTLAPASQVSVKAGSKLVQTVRYAQFKTNVARIVIDTIGQPQYQAVEKKGILEIFIVNPISKGITYFNSGDSANLNLTGITLTDAKSSTNKLFTEKSELDGKKYTITFSSKIAKLENKSVKVNDSFIDSIVTSSSATSGNSSITFTTKTKLSYQVVPQSNAKGTAVKVSKPQETNRGDIDRDGSQNSDTNQGTNTGTPDKGATNPGTVDPGKTDAGTAGGSTDSSNLQSLDIKYISNAVSDEVDLNIGSYAGYSVMRLTGPDRIVIDVPKTSAPNDQQTINVNSSLVKTIRFSQNDNNVARAVIDTAGQMQYQVIERSGQLAIFVSKPAYKNITYSNNGDRVNFLLNGATLTQGGETLKPLYTGSYDSTGLIYTVTFPGNLADIGTGTIFINDGLLNSVDITQNSTTNQTSMVFSAKDKFLYEIITREDGNGTSIDILKPYTKADRLVVIDPGHGGSDPGATYGSVKEKDLNLDISMRLNALLKAKGVKTYITREDDSFVGLYERAHIANDLNATLFLCVHNNANDTVSKGTETLYYPSTSGFGKTFAQMIQDSLIGTLGTIDRKIVPRPGLVVLKDTSMPAVLAEIGFLDNTSDRALLLDENFRQKAAQALCDATIQAISVAP
jgi:N-acetylmuramoyl-L-alanine amidase